MLYAYSSVIIMYLLFDYCLVLFGCFMFYILLLVDLCDGTCSMHFDARHALVYNLKIYRVGVMHAILFDLLIRVRVMHVLVLKCALVPDFRVKILGGNDSIV